MDTKKRGSLDFTDFAIAMHLIKASMDGKLSFIPTYLPPLLYKQASSLAAKINKDQTRTQFDILDKSLITADADREALAPKQGHAIRANDSLSPSTDMKNDQGQLDRLNGSPVVANAEFKAPTVNQSTPPAQLPLLSTQNDTLGRLLDASNAKEELARAFASQETELVSLSTKSRNDQGLIDVLNGSLATANTAYEGTRKVITSQATGLAFLSAKTRNDQAQIDTLNRSLSTVEAENEKLKRAAVEHRFELSVLSANSKCDQGRIDALNRSLTTERAEQEELRQLCTSQAAEILSLTAQMKAGKDRSYNLARSFLKEREERIAIKQAFDLRANELSILSAKTQDQQTQINALHTLLHTTTAELLDARNQLSSKNATGTHLLEELREQMDGQLNELHGFLDTTIAERETLRGALSAQAAELLYVQNQLSSANAANSNRISLVNELRKQLNEGTEEFRSTSEASGRGRNDSNASRHRATRSKTGELKVRTGIQIHTQQDELEVPHLTYAHSTNAVAGPSRINTTTYTKLHGTGRQPALKCERIRCPFKCGVCMDEKPMDDVTLLDPCGHQFCRGCVKGYVSAKLDDHSFPILCPVCMTDGGRANPGST